MANDDCKFIVLFAYIKYYLLNKNSQFQITYSYLHNEFRELFII
jgi:hypothetical protein